MKMILIAGFKGKMSLELQPSSLDEIQTDTRSSMTGIEMMTRKSAHTLGILESPLVNQPTNPGMWKLSKLRVPTHSETKHPLS